MLHEDSYLLFNNCTVEHQYGGKSQFASNTLLKYVLTAKKKYTNLGKSDSKFYCCSNSFMGK